MKLHRAFCHHLKRLRTEKGYTQSQMAMKLKISRPRYTEIENGKYVAKLNLVERVAKALRVNPLDLLKDPPRNRH